MGEPLAGLLRPGNAGSNTAADHIAVTRAALAQLPGIDASRPGRRVLIRTDGAGATHEFVNWLVRRRLSYSLGFTLPTGAEQLIAKMPASAWTPAYDADGQIRSGAFVAELTGLQAELLDAAVAVLAPGGVLAYVTCSPHVAETVVQVQDLVRRHPELELLDAGTALDAVALDDLRLDEAEPAGAPEPGDVVARTAQLWPHRHGTDAMFYAVLRKIGTLG